MISLCFSGATKESGLVKFLVKWSGMDVADLVPAEEAKKRIPHLVIRFYEERLHWSERTREAVVRKLAHYM